MFDRTSTGTSSKLSAASTRFKSSMKSLLGRFSRKSSTSRTSPVLLGTSEPITPTDSSRSCSPFPSAPPVTSVSSPYQSGGDITRSTSTYNTSSTSSLANTPIRGSESLDSVSTSSTFESGSPLLSERRSTGSQGTGRVIWSSTDGFDLRSPTSFPASPQYLENSILPSASPTSANTVHTAATLFSMKSPLLLSYTGDGFSEMRWGTNVSTPYFNRSDTSLNLLVPSPTSPVTSPASFQTDIIYTEYGGNKSPLYGDSAISLVSGRSSPSYTGPDREGSRNTPPHSPFTTQSIYASV